MEAYRAMFAYFNAQLFDGALPEVLLNLSRRAKSLGFFAADRWEHVAGATRTHEISLNPDFLHQAPREVASTLVHEMAHLWRHLNGEPGRRAYHDRLWADRMIAIGLMPSATGKPGGRQTGQKMDHYIVEGGPFALAFEKMPPAYLLPWRTQGALDPAPAKKKGKRGTAGDAGSESESEGAPKGDPSKRKYTCGGCGSNVWGRGGLKLACLDCEMLFVCQGEAHPSDVRIDAEQLGLEGIAA